MNTLAALLKEPKTDPNLKAGFQIALHFLVINNDLNCTNLLLEKSASVSIPNSMEPFIWRRRPARHDAADTEEKQTAFEL